MASICGTLPILIWVHDHEMWDNWGVGGILVVLEHNDRICIIDLGEISGSQFENVLASKEQHFPEPTRLQLDRSFLLCS
jgi:hypothetical protein